MLLPLTRRGWGTLGVVVACVAMAVAFGARSLAAVIVPLLLAVLAALIGIRRTGRPEVHRRVPPDGFVGETRPVELTFDVSKPTSGVVRDALGDGLSTDDGRIETTVGGNPVTYDVTYEGRGVHDLGPVTLSVTDVLGLATRTFEYHDRDSIVVYPQVYELAGATRSELAMLAGSALDREREEFDRLREYESGDSLRDVHWKSSAKRATEDLVVKEFVAEDDVGDVTIALEATEGNADGMAEAAASLAIHFLSLGVAVGMHLPGGLSIQPDAGADHRTRLLEHLARVKSGELAPTEGSGADVYVGADDGGVVVRVDDHETTFADLAGLSDRNRTRIDAGEGESATSVAATEVFP